MCGRFAIQQSNDELAQFFGAEVANNLPIFPNYNICPTDTIPVIVSNGEIRRMGGMRWGFVPSWYKTPTDGPLLINARAETIAQKPAFKDAVRSRRCIIPMTGYFEWIKDGDQRVPYFTQNTDGSIMAVGGIWQAWKGLEKLITCSIVTVSSNESMVHLHHRMPLILAPSNWGKWLGEQGHGAATLMQPTVDGMQAFYKVSEDVNSNRASGAYLIEQKQDLFG